MYDAIQGAIPGTIQDTSKKKWVILFVCFLTFLISFIDRLTWSVVALPVSDALGLPISALAVFATAFYAGYVCNNMIGGLWADRFGSRIVLTGSMLALGSMTFLFGGIVSVPSGIVVQLLMGLAAGADYSACVKLILGWFGPHERGRAMGLFLIASSLGIVLTNAIIPVVVDAFGWAGTYRVLGVVTLLIGVTTFVLVRDGGASLPRSTISRRELKAILFTREMVLLALTGFGAFWGTWGFAFWANALMVKNYGLSAVQAGWVVSVVGLAAIIGKPVGGWLSDRLGGRPREIVIAILVLFAVMLTIFGTLSTMTGFLLAAPLLGIGAFVYSPLLAVLVADAAGPRLAGSATGITAGLWQLGSVIVPVAVGLVFSATSSFQAAFLTLAIGPAIGCVCMILLRTPRRVAADA